MTKRILIVEDDYDFGVLLAELLQTSGFVTATAADGLMALEHLETADAHPDVIMLDLMMPRMDGWQFRAEQTKRPEIASIPVIVMSADSNIDKTAREIQAAGFVMKPPEVAALMREIDRVLAETEGHVTSRG